MDFGCENPILLYILFFRFLPSPFHRAGFGLQKSHITLYFLFTFLLFHSARRISICRNPILVYFFFSFRLPRGGFWVMENPYYIIFSFSFCLPYSERKISGGRNTILLYIFFFTFHLLHSSRWISDEEIPYYFINFFPYNLTLLYYVFP